MSWRFPEVKFTKENDSSEQIDHVLSEAGEVEYIDITEGNAVYVSQRIDEEMADLYHSVETYFRIRQREGVDVHEIFAKVIEKNQARGYYDAD